MVAHLLRCLCCLGTLLLGPVLIAQAELASPLGPALDETELDALVAPIALYPDLVLGQVIEASMDPSTLVAAGDLLCKPGNDVKAPASWPGAVKVMMHVPSVLQMLDESLPWTTRLGNAAKVSRADVQAAVQRVRRKASMAGNLASDDKLKVIEDGDLLKIELADPSVLYVPEYDPAQMFEQHAAGSEPWFGYGPPITIPGFKNVADGLESLHYVHTTQQYHHGYYGEPKSKVVVSQRRRAIPWRGWGHNH